MDSSMFMGALQRLGDAKGNWQEAEAEARKAARAHPIETLLCREATRKARAAYDAYLDAQIEFQRFGTIIGEAGPESPAPAAGDLQWFTDTVPDDLCDVRAEIYRNGDVIEVDAFYCDDGRWIAVVDDMPRAVEMVRWRPFTAQEEEDHVNE